MSSRLNSLTIRTPEGVSFSYQLAGPVTRLLAWMIDVMIVYTLLTTAGLAFMLIAGILGLSMLSLDLSITVVLLLSFILPVLYGMLMEWFYRGQTYGKRALGLRVIDEQGLKLQFSQVVVRNLMRFVDALPINLYLVGGISCLISRKAQRLGDLAASTLVIRSTRPMDPDLEQITSVKYNSLRNYPHLESRLRQRVSAREAAIALQAIMRRESLTPEARVQLFDQLASHLKSVVEFPQEAIDGVTDEQYVRNVVDILFSSRAQKPV